MEQPAWNNNTWGYDTLSRPFHSGPMYLVNAREFLDAAGEWYLDTAAGQLYYKPLSTENMTTADVQLPRLESLLRIGGTYAVPAHHISFSGVQFSHTSWLQPNTGQGYADQQTGAYIYGTWARPSDWLNSCQQGCQQFEATRPNWRQMPAAVQVSAANAIRFTGNRFTNLGQIGLGIGNDANAHATGVGLGASDIDVIGNVFEQISAGAVIAGGAGHHHPSDTRMINRDIVDGVVAVDDVPVGHPGVAGVVGVGLHSAGDDRPGRELLETLPITSTSRAPSPTPVACASASLPMPRPIWPRLVNRLPVNRWRWPPRPAPPRASVASGAGGLECGQPRLAGVEPVRRPGPGAVDVRAGLLVGVALAAVGLQPAGVGELHARRRRCGGRAPRRCRRPSAATPAGAAARRPWPCSRRSAACSRAGRRRCPGPLPGGVEELTRVDQVHRPEWKGG